MADTKICPTCKHWDPEKGFCKKKVKGICDGRGCSLWEKIPIDRTKTQDNENQESLF